MKGGHKEGTQNKKESPPCSIDGHPPIQKYEYIPGNVRKNNLKCGNILVLREFVHRVFSLSYSISHERHVRIRNDCELRP